MPKRALHEQQQEPPPSTRRGGGHTSSSSNPVAAQQDPKHAPTAAGGPSNAQADGMQDTITVSPDESSWQAGFGKLASTLFMSESLSDVKLVSVDGEEMPAHRLVLCAHSDMLVQSSNV